MEEALVCANCKKDIDVFARLEGLEKVKYAKNDKTGEILCEDCYKLLCEGKLKCPKEKK